MPARVRDRTQRSDVQPAIGCPAARRRRPVPDPLSRCSRCRHRARYCCRRGPLSSVEAQAQRVVRGIVGRDAEGPRVRPVRRAISRMWHRVIGLGRSLGRRTTRGVCPTAPSSTPCPQPTVGNVSSGCNQGELRITTGGFHGRQSVVDRPRRSQGHVSRPVRQLARHTYDTGLVVRYKVSTCSNVDVSSRLSRDKRSPYSRTTNQAQTEIASELRRSW